MPERHAILYDEVIGSTGPWTAALKQARGFIHQTPGAIVALLSNRGHGKTELAVCLMIEALKAQQQARYYKAMDLFAHLRDAMHAGREEETIRVLSGLDLLILDDLHERSESDYENRSLVNLVDHRYDGLKPTILTANYAKSAFAKAAGDSIVSRMHQVGLVIECNWPSFRERGTDAR